MAARETTFASVGPRGRTYRDACGRAPALDLVGERRALFVARAAARAKAFSYDPDTDRLSRATGRLSYGRHPVRVAAEDAAGNVAERT